MRDNRIYLTLLLFIQSSNIINSSLWDRFYDGNSQLHTEEVAIPISNGTLKYGVDISFPMHHSSVSTNYAWLPHNVNPAQHKTPRKYINMPINPLGDRQSFHDAYMRGCREHYGLLKGIACTAGDWDRIDMNLKQPQSMQNYTKIGFAKVKAPDDLFNAILQFWEKNKDNGQEEVWGIGNIFTNNWESKTEMVSVEDQNLRGSGAGLKRKIWSGAKKIISEWTGQELTPTSLYGIRVYKDGAILAPHVDRLPLVSSAIINVAQDLDEPWPLEVIGHDGKATNVTMEPGDMVLYESHSIIHGRPFPMKGRFMANIFVHFEPTGHSIRHNMKIDESEGADVNTKYRETAARGIGGHENDNAGLPLYIKPDTFAAREWRRKHGTNSKIKPQQFETGSTSVHEAAKVGDVDMVYEHIMKQKDLVNEKDENGWTPLHEGARGGHLEVVKLLVENGADVSARTANDGTSALYWAKKTHGDDSEVVKFLEGMGALDIGPEL